MFYIWGIFALFCLQIGGVPAIYSGVFNVHNTIGNFIWDLIMSFIKRLSAIQGYPLVLRELLL